MGGTRQVRNRRRPCASLKRPTICYPASADYRRRLAAGRQRRDAMRVDERPLFTRQTDTLQRRIQEDMHAVSYGIYRLSQQFRAELDDYLDINTSFVRKYSLLLVVYIMLSGWWQRPQVYCSFQNPKDALSSLGKRRILPLYPAPLPSKITMLLSQRTATQVESKKLNQKDQTL
jgi:hypothetical protein